LEIKTKDINIKNMVLTLPGRTKLKSRKISIPDHFRSLINSEIHLKEPEDHLFSGRNGKLHTRTVQKLFDKIKSSTGIGLSIHLIRKSLAIHLYNAGWSEKSICSFMGHSHLQSTKKMLKGIIPPESKTHPINNILINAA
jgi:integrase